MSFLQYIKRYSGSNIPEGTFADDVLHDKLFPRYTRKYQKQSLTLYHAAITEHLHAMNACREALVIFEKLWSEYINSRSLQ